MGNQTSLTYPDGGVVTNTYDAVYDLTQVQDPEEGVYAYEYDDAGNVTKLTYPNGWIEEYTYDAEGNLTKVVDTDPFVTYNKTSTKYEYDYDANGNVTREYDRDSGETKRAQTSTYTYDALGRLTHVTETSRGYPTVERAYLYDTLGNMIQEEADECLEYHYHGATLYESRECCERAEYNGIKRWDYTYDGRGNLVSVDKYQRTTQGMQLVNSEKYVYDETNKLVQGTNEDGEVSRYTYNGLGVRVGRELIVKDNTHGYTDFHKQTPSVETGLDKPEVVKEDYVIDYTRLNIDQRVLMKSEEGGYDFRWVYGLDALQVKVTGPGSDWWGQQEQTDILTAYTHHDRLGSIVNLTDKYGRNIARADYQEYGEIAFYESITVSGGYRRIAPQLVYTNHEWDDVLDLYYAKARFYDADDKRFLSMDPVKGRITDPQSLVPYVYCIDNPLKWTDPLGLRQVVTTENVNFRQGPGKSYTKWRVLAKGTVVDDMGSRVDADDGYTWANVDYNGYSGWIASQYLKETSELALKLGDRKIVTENYVNMRAAPGLNGKIIGRLNRGDAVEYLHHSSPADGYNWAKVRYGEKVGWVADAYLRDKTSPQAVKDLAEAAKPKADANQDVAPSSNELTEDDIYNAFAAIGINLDRNATKSRVREIVQGIGKNDLLADITKNGWFKELFYLGGFVQDWSNGDLVYHARQDCLQQYGGYNTLYDIAFDLGTDMKADRAFFEYDGIQYVIWMWKGDYLNLGAGAEMGIYRESSIAGHWDVDTSLALPMTLRLTTKDGREVFNYEPSEPQWWITGFRPSYQDVVACILVATYTIDFSERKEWFEPVQKGAKMGSKSKWIFDPDTYIATIIFD